MSNKSFKSINANDLVTATGGQNVAHQIKHLNYALNAAVNPNNPNNQANQTTQMMTFAMLGMAMRNQNA